MQIERLGQEGRTDRKGLAADRRLPGDHEEERRRESFAHVMRELQPVHVAGHLHVGQHDPDLAVPREQRDRLLGVARPEHAPAPLREDVEDVEAQGLQDDGLDHRRHVLQPVGQFAFILRMSSSARLPARKSRVTVP